MVPERHVPGDLQRWRVIDGFVGRSPLWIRAGRDPLLVEIVADRYDAATSSRRRRLRHLHRHVALVTGAVTPPVTDHQEIDRWRGGRSSASGQARADHRARDSRERRASAPPGKNHGRCATGAPQPKSAARPPTSPARRSGASQDPAPSSSRLWRSQVSHGPHNDHPTAPR